MKTKTKPVSGTSKFKHRHATVAQHNLFARKCVPPRGCPQCPLRARWTASCGSTSLLHAPLTLKESVSNEGRNPKSIQGNCHNPSPRHSPCRDSQDTSRANHDQNKTLHWHRFLPLQAKRHFHTLVGMHCKLTSGSAGNRWQFRGRSTADAQFRSSTIAGAARTYAGRGTNQRKRCSRHTQTSQAPTCQLVRSETDSLIEMNGARSSAPTRGLPTSSRLGRGGTVEPTLLSRGEVWGLARCPSLRTRMAFTMQLGLRLWYDKGAFGGFGGSIE